MARAIHSGYYEFDSREGECAESSGLEPGTIWRQQRDLGDAEPRAADDEQTAATREPAAHAEHCISMPVMIDATADLARPCAIATTHSMLDRVHDSQIMRERALTAAKAARQSAELARAAARALQSGHYSPAPAYLAAEASRAAVTIHARNNHVRGDNAWRDGGGGDTPFSGDSMMDVMMDDDCCAEPSMLM